ncbi:methyltransferase domain-containing protein [Nocardioides acrostichi]|uniref:Methyltransferase domain-containing protein n=1 Tax=Nocardioides acrostichi TaxID=2784339 RepID=A0A930Y4V7_9ACTN|nr:methyltransferase domain-containing protein [Nocardioides acrostichi]MBF4160610.1 methyltransferase domain-containing protein [Nocardioides acrostichi]
MSASERPSERRSAARTAVVWNDLGPLLDAGTALDVLDIGGGTGVSAVRVAAGGHRVTVVDPSPDALASLARRAREQGVEVVAHQGELSSLLDIVGEASADLVLCHGVLEFVADPAAALATLRRALRPGASLSLLVAQRHAAVVARAMAGHFGQARELLDAAPEHQQIGRAGRRYTADEATALLAEAGFAVASVHGVRVFADLVPGSLLDLEPGATASLVDLEQTVATRPEFLPLATQLHLLAR